MHGWGAPRDAQIFHCDFHDFKWVKLLIYLTNVDAEAGSHVLIKGTHALTQLPRRMFKLEQHDPVPAKGVRGAFVTQAQLSGTLYHVIDDQGPDPARRWAGAHRRYAHHVGDKAVDPAFWRYTTWLVIRDPELETA